MQTNGDGKIVLSLDLEAVRRGFEAREKLRERDGGGESRARIAQADELEQRQVRERAKLDETIQSDKGRLLNIVV